jgi:hypothetical protein
METQNKLPEAQREPSDLKLFTLWKEYESIAMHFNDLLIRLRTQTLGGVAAFAAIAAIVVRGDIAPLLRWSVLVAAFGLLTVFWIAIRILDLGYYNRLLLGAVEAILEIEKTSAEHKPVDEIILSTRIEEIATGKKKINQSSLEPVTRYYNLVLTGLLICLGVSLIGLFWSQIIGILATLYHYISQLINGSH